MHWKLSLQCRCVGKQGSGKHADKVLPSGISSCSYMIKSVCEGVVVFDSSATGGTMGHPREDATFFCLGSGVLTLTRHRHLDFRVGNLPNCEEYIPTFINIPSLWNSLRAAQLGWERKGQSPKKERNLDKHHQQVLQLSHLSPTRSFPLLLGLLYSATHCCIFSEKRTKDCFCLLLIITGL